MARCSAPHARLTIAAALSALAHFLVVASVAPGGPVRPGAMVTSPASLDVRLVFAEPQAPVMEPVPRENSRPLPRVTRVEPRAAPSRAATPAQAPAADGAAHIPDPTYYGARQLDVYPMLATPIGREHLENAGAANASGRVLLLVLIDADGVVDDVSVVDGGTAADLERAARIAFSGARFKPAQRNGRPVKSRILVEVTYGREIAEARN